MSEFSSFPLFVKTNLETRPQDFIVTDAAITKIEQAQAVRRAAEDKAKPPEPLRVEYNRLRRELYDKQQYAKHTEIYCNEKAGSVKHFEQSINDWLKQKKAAVEVGHLGQERFCEHQVELLEAELLDAKIEFNRAKHQSANAARALKAFDGYARIKQLEKELDTPKIIGKE
jgi:hypothetical protein